jgi:hypothetical protein
MGGLFGDRGGGSATGSLAPPPSSHLSFYHMNVVLEEPAGVTAGDGGSAAMLDEVTPLFKLVPGHAASSYGTACAAKAGVPAAVLRRATAVTAALRSNSPILPAQAWTRNARRAAWEHGMIAVLKAAHCVAASRGAARARTGAADGGSEGDGDGSAAGGGASPDCDLAALMKAVQDVARLG